MNRFHTFHLVVSLSCLCACTRGGPSELPDASFRLDAGSDSGPMVEFPTPTIDSCTEEGRDSTLGNDCLDEVDCDDGCFCNGLEECQGEHCVAAAEPCVDDVECTSDACLEETNQCFHDPRHQMCSDGDACNGAEICDGALGCRPASPLYCNDEDSCTLDSCDAMVGCVHLPRDLDGDGHVAVTCGGDDCDDDPRSGTGVYPGSTEDCMNRRDDDCDGLRDFDDEDCRPLNGTCATALPIDSSGIYSGSTSGLLNDYTPSCGGAGPDAVFRLSLAESKDVRLTVASAVLGFSVAVRPWDSCESGPDDRCNAAAPPVLLRRSLPMGDYAIIVNSTAGAAFALSVTVSDPTPIPPVDICSGSTEDVSGGGTFAGVFSDVADDYVLSCHGGTTAFDDVAYRFTISSVKDVVLTASTTGASAVSTYMALVRDCADATSTVACVSGGSPEIRRRELPAGTYYVLLESSSVAASGWTLDVDLVDPVPRLPGDACSSSVDITDGPGVVSGASAELDVGVSCTSFIPPTRDLFFYFDLAQNRNVTVSTTAGYHYVTLNTECGELGSELRCRSGSPLVTELYRDLDPGRYYVTVGTTTTGDVSASIETSPATAVPGNDRCAGAIDLVDGYSSTDTLLGFEDDLVACSGSSRPDAFYRLVLTQRKAVSVLASRVSGSGDIYLTLRNSCTVTTNLRCDNGNPAVIDVVLDPGTYYLIVEATSEFAAGDFTLRAFLSDP